MLCKCGREMEETALFSGRMHFGCRVCNTVVHVCERKGKERVHQIKLNYRDFRALLGFVENRSKHGSGEALSTGAANPKRT